MTLSEVLSTIAAVIAVLSLCVSGVTLWLTLIRRGEVKMSRPTLIAFTNYPGSDGPKLHFSSLLYSTAKSGHVIESMYVRLRRGETSQTFNGWFYDGKDHLSRGSGIIVGPEGAVHDHHFTLPKDGTSYEFLPGEYMVEVYGSPAGKEPMKLFADSVRLSESLAAIVKNQQTGVFFDWGPDSGAYHAHIPPPKERPEGPVSLPMVSAWRT